MLLKIKKTIGIALAVLSVLPIQSTCRGDEFDDFWNLFYNEFYQNSAYDNSEYLTPVITSPKSYDTILSSDEVTITWKYTGSDNCIVSVQDETGYISEIPAENGNKARIMPNKLAKGYSYTITVKAGNAVSEPFILKIADAKQEIVEIISRTKVEKAEERISKETIIPDGAFENKESADKYVKTISVKVWDLNANNQKVTKTIAITVNAQLADTVTKIFDEIYQNQLHFPIKSASCYSYRTTASGGRLSEHAYGTAIDINPNENYCVYSEGNIVGSLYEPYQNPYSVVPEIINIFRKYNFHWGGSFGDYMHFSYFAT